MSTSLKDPEPDEEGARATRDAAGAGAPLGHCRLCRSTTYRTLFVKMGLSVARCSRCGFVFLDFEATRDFLESYYDEGFFHDQGTKHGFSNYDRERQSIQRTFEERARRLRLHQPTGRLLDVGCATGLFLEVASRWWETAGVEISAYACRRARERGLAVFQGELKDMPLPTDALDVVTLWDTIEHVADPAEVIRQIGRLVKPGGIVAFTTGDVSSWTARASGRLWHLYNIPQHLSYFDRASVTQMLQQGGFQVVEITYPAVHFTVDYLLFRLLTFYRLPFAMRLYRLLSGTWIARRSLRINLRDIMLVVGRRMPAAAVAVSATAGARGAG